MKLYNSVTAPNPRRVRIFLAEKNISVPTIDLDLSKGASRTPEFLKINPMGQAPVLELDDGTIIAETVAICRYFEETHPQPALFGQGAKGHAIVEMWQRRTELYIFETITDIFRNQSDFFKGRVHQIPEYGEVQRGHLMPRLEWLNRELAQRRFIAGDEYSIADITLTVALMLAPRANVTVEPKLTHLNRWYAEMAQRPSFKA